MRGCVLVEIQTTEMATKHTCFLRKSHPEAREHEVGIPDGKKGEHIGGKISYKGEEETRGNEALYQVMDNPN